MTDLEQQILDIIQDGFPIAERPYAVIADLLNHAVNRLLEKIQNPHSEQSVFDAVEHLRDCGIIRRIGGVYDSRKLGYISRLCAGVVPSVANGASDDSAIEKFAATVDKIPAITHNYVRSHHYNIWFTVIAESEEAVQAIVRRLEESTELHDVHCLPAKRMFKINTVMKEARGTRNENVAASDERVAESRSAAHFSPILTDSDKCRIRLLSGDLPHSLAPFVDLCEKCGCELDEFLNKVREDLATRRMRRFGAVLRHQNAGFAHNAMVCFGIDERDVCGLAGEILASNPHVSHCYERPPFENFPYNLYAMFHAESAELLEQYIAEAVQKIKAQQYAVLHSIKELKKQSFQYFI